MLRRMQKQMLKPGVITAVIAVLVLAATPAGRADVVSSAADGFTVKTTVTIHASPADVYRKIVKDVGNWWDSSHTFSGDAHNMSIDERPLGCFCEKLPGNGAIRHMEVIYFQPGKVLRMSGGIGPLQSMAVSAVATFNLSPDGDGTKLVFTYSVGGYAPPGLDKIAPVANTVLTEQIMRLKNYIETGNPAGKDKG
jgi:hypothetical protein